MKKDTTELSRRAFLSKGTVAAGASIIAIQAIAPQSTEAEVTPMLTNDPVYTESTQTLSNKKIKSWQNILGTDHVNVREFTITSGNITDALDDAIEFLQTEGFGGKILIPHGVYTTSGGHELSSGITIEGVGISTDPYDGTELVSTGGTSGYVFRITSPTRNVTLKDFTINMGSSTTAIGLLMTDRDGTDLNIYNTTLENIYFNGGGYGIKVDSVENSGTPTHFECIMNRFEKVIFFGCVTSFYCNTGNSGFLFDSCYFNIPPYSLPVTVSGTALDCKYIGYAEFSNCLFIGGGLDWSEVTAGLGSTVLKTTGSFGSIYFHNCQDENIRYNYQKGTYDYPDATVVYKNCLLQGKYRFTAHGAVTFENCQINVTGGAVKVTDTSTAAVRIFLKGLNRYFNTGSPQPIQEFENAWSQVVYEAQEINAPVIHPAALLYYYPATYTVNATRGAVQVVSGTDYVVVYNKYVGVNSLIFAQFREDPGSTAIKYVKAAVTSGGDPYFEIHLTANAASTLSIGFTVVG
jgi:hypothetical protein